LGPFLLHISAASFRISQAVAEICGLAPGSPTNATQGRIFAPNLALSNLQFATLRARIEEEAKFWRLRIAQQVGVELLLEVTVRS